MEAGVRHENPEQKSFNAGVDTTRTTHRYPKGCSCGPRASHVGSKQTASTRTRTRTPKAETPTNNTDDNHDEGRGSFGGATHDL